jgi:phosphatidylglycerol---prolipoprotein diacylglyceryl transferase
MLLLPLSAIAFPNIDPVALQIGPLAIRWYGLAWIAGHPVRLVVRQAPVSNERLWPGGQGPCKPADIDDFLIWAAIGTLVGGRVGYVLFYDFAAFAANPLQIFAIWQGGMSFHGGFLGTTLR